ncbi:hypothetical protein Hdeb2414_s0023g00639071 [Helianthus debilis subsp. tardiflorus]
MAVRSNGFGWVAFRWLHSDGLHLDGSHSDGSHSDGLNSNEFWCDVNFQVKHYVALIIVDTLRALVR